MLHISVHRDPVNLTSDKAPGFREYNSPSAPFPSPLPFAEMDNASNTGLQEAVEYDDAWLASSCDPEDNQHPSLPIPHVPRDGNEAKFFSSPMEIDGIPIHSSGQREVFVFGFGAIVFWGFPRGEEASLLDTIRSYVVKGLLNEEEFQHGEDDMAFVTADFKAGDISIQPETVLENQPSNSLIYQLIQQREREEASSLTSSITIANDVISVPENSSVKSRLAVSFAIAQSAVLAVFEARIERKIEDYKYIPETLARNGKVKLSPKQLGMMIGEVFVIRHDVNLHSEILDKPDYFW